MTVTNTSDGGRGICMTNAKVELFDVALKGCRHIGVFSTFGASVVATRCEFANTGNGNGAVVRGSLTSATFKNCVFHDNEYDGIYASDQATVHLHGEATAIHSNKRNGITAADSSKVLIHLPSHHNTSYKNEMQDRNSTNGGTITNVED